MAQSRIAQLKWPVLILAILIGPALFLDDLLQELGVKVVETAINVLKHILTIGLWLSLAWLLVRMIDVFVWQGIIRDRLGGSVPKLLKDVVAAIVFIVAITGILSFVFELNLTGLWATSGVLTLVVGFAVQSMIADVFSGIALNIDQPFKMGEWVTVHHRGIEAMTGRVEEINWRSVKIWRTDGTIVIVPNSLMSTTITTNLSRPNETSRFKLRFCLDFQIPKERALRILNAGVRAAKGPLAEPRPKVRVNGVTKWGVEYEARYWLDPAAVSPSKGRHAVAGAVLEHLHHAGLTLAYEKQDLYVAAMPPRQLDTRSDKTSLLRRVDLFSELDDAEIHLLSERVKELTFDEQTDIVSAGAEGESMYLLVEGLLHVYAPTDDGADLLVAQLEPGHFFGEMSLLTGEPRSATVRAGTACVVYEVTKADLTVLLDDRPEIAEVITRAVAERKVASEQQKAKAANNGAETEVEAEGFAQQLLGKMKSFFGGRNGKNGARADA